MAASAPLFLAPREIMREVEEGLARTSIHDMPRTVISAKEKASANEFLNVLQMSMPSARVGNGGPTCVTAQGHQKGLTENESATFVSSGSHCLDFLFQVVPTTPPSEVERLLGMAWREDDLKALKLAFHLRGVRGTGKADKERFYHAALWMHENHPATLCANVAAIAAFGYFKDLPELTLRLVEGSDGTLKRSRNKQRRAQGIPLFERILERRDGKTEKAGLRLEASSSMTRRRKAGTLKPREERVAASLERDREDQLKAASLRRKKRSEMARRVTKKFYQDSQFKALYLEVARVFAERLKGDLKALQEGRTFEISLAAKWTPSLDSSYDLRTMLCYAIATQVFPKEDHAEYAPLDNYKYGFAVRERLRKEVLVPIRKVLELPEVYMSARKWGEVNYRRVASVAMSRYKQHFLKYDEERFSRYLEDVVLGKQKMAAGALLPHIILKEAIYGDEDSSRVAELQWKRVVEDLKELGTLNNCLAVCDVSGSMHGEPIQVCIALGILLSDLSEEPWKGNVITFSNVPNIHEIKGDNLRDKAKFVRCMDWNLNTNLQLVFDKILEMASINKLAPEKMIQRLFIFSDMEFDEASSTPWETDYQAICRKFESHGFGSPPQVVFWNLRHSSSIPVIKSEPGVGLVSGFSKNIFKIFLAENGEIDPMKVMDRAIAGEEYATLTIVD